MNFDIIVPISFFVMVFLLIRLLLNQQAKKRSQWHQTLQTAIQNDLPIPDELWQRLILAADPRRSDLRKAWLFFVMTTALLIMGLLMSFQAQEERKVIYLMATLPGGFSLMYFFFWHFWHRT